MEKLRDFVRPYKNNYLLRFIVIVCTSVLLWFLASGGTEERFIYPIMVWMMEYLTINMIYDMDFSPYGVFARRAFGTKDHPGYKATYIFVYVCMWIMVVITFVDGMKDKGVF